MNAAHMMDTEQEELDTQDDEPVSNVNLFGYSPDDDVNLTEDEIEYLTELYEMYAD